MATSVRYNDFHLSPPKEYFLPSNPIIRPGDITRRSVSLAEVVSMKESHLAAERKSHEKILQQDALSRLRCEKTFDDLKQINIRCHEQTEKVNRRIESVLAVEPRFSESIKRLEERCDELGKNLETAKKEKVETRRLFTEGQAQIEAEIATKRSSEREVASKEALRRRIIEKDVAARRGDLERRKSQVRHERANVHQIDRRVQGLAKTDINLSSLSAGSMKSCLEKARNEFSFLQSQLVEMDLAWKRLPEDRAKLFLQSQELAPEVRIDTPTWSPRDGGTAAKSSRHGEGPQKERMEAMERAIRETWARVKEKRREIAELENALSDDSEQEESGISQQEGSHVITGDVFAVLRPPAAAMAAGDSENAANMVESL